MAEALPPFIVDPLPALTAAKDAVLALDERQRDAIRRINDAMSALIDEGNTDPDAEALAEWRTQWFSVGAAELGDVRALTEDARSKLKACEDDLVMSRARTDGRDNGVTIDGGRYLSHHHYVVQTAEAWCRVMDYAVTNRDRNWLVNANPHERSLGLAELRTRVELESAAARRYVEQRDATATQDRRDEAGDDGSATVQPITHSIDYASVNWNGTLYTFTANQAACVKVL